MNLKDVHYDGFISYRHNERDRFIALNLHKKLEGFKLPSSAKKLTKSGKTKIERVFRDEDELSIADSLSSLITTAIDNSEFLIAICSPEYLESTWCQKEIETFLKTHDKKHILLVLADGEPEQAFPETMRYEETLELDSNGNTISVKKDIEPLAADVRGKNKKEILEALDNAVIKLAAAIFGLDYEDLKQRRMKQRMQEMAVFWGSIASIFLVFSLICFFMMLQIDKKNELITDQYTQIEDQYLQIENQYAEIQDKYATQMAEASKDLYLLGRKKDAVYAVRSVLPDSSLEKFNKKAYTQLIESMNIYNVGNWLSPDCMYEIDSISKEFAVSGDGKYIVIYGNIGDLNFFDADRQVLLDKRIITEKYYIPNKICACGEQGFVYLDGSDLYYWDPHKNNDDVLLEKVSYIFPIPDNKGIAAVTNQNLVIIDGSGRITNTISGEQLGLKMFDWFSISDVTFNDDASVMAFAFRKNNSVDEMTIFVADIVNNTIINSYVFEYHSLFNVNFYGDSIIYSWNDGVFMDNSEYSCYGRINAYDGSVIWEEQIIPDFYCMNVLVCDEVCFMYEYDEIRIIDMSNGEWIESVDSDSPINYMAPVNDSLALAFTRDGGIYFVNKFRTESIGFWEFRLESGIDVAQTIYQDGFVYYLYNKNNYLTRFDGFNASREYPDYEYDRTEEEKCVIESEEIKEYFKNDEDVNADIIMDAVVSDDDKYIAVNVLNNKIDIYNKESHVKVCSINSDGLGLYSVKYIRELGYYAINNAAYTYYMNDDEEIEFISGRAYDYKDGNFIIQGPVKYYMVPYLTYEEIIDLADSFLGDYVPSEDICEDYSITPK